MVVGPVFQSPLGRSNKRGLHSYRFKPANLQLSRFLGRVPEPDLGTVNNCPHLRSSPAWGKIGICFEVQLLAPQSCHRVDRKGLQRGDKTGQNGNDNHQQR